MPALLLALPLALLSLTAQAGDHAHDHTAAGSLGKHQHGIGELDVALDGPRLELHWRSPAANLLGFEHAPHSAEQHAAVARLQALLLEPSRLFGLPDAADCQLREHRLDSPLFAAEAQQHSAQTATHSEIQVRYAFNCRQPAALQALDCAELFRQFPATETLHLQLIGPQGQQGGELSAAHSRLSF